ncbi:MAG: hypothetical protein Kow00104_11640 [Rhodothalassiaceae bacterium]
MSDEDPASAVLYLREEEIRRGIGLLLRAARILGTPDAEALADCQLRPAHFMPLLMIVRHPGLPLSELLSMLRIRKQSLQPLLETLITRGLVEMRAASADRRRRCLFPTEAGLAVERRLSAPLRLRLAAAYRREGPQAVAGLKGVLGALVGDDPETGA